MSFTYLTDSFAVSPQITVDELRSLQDQGFVGVVCNRPDNEEPGLPSADDIKAACDALGLAFAHIPMRGPIYNDNDIQALRDMMAKGKTFAYCRSGNRSGQALEKLNAAGQVNVKDLQGGVKAWVASGRSLVSPY